MWKHFELLLSEVILALKMVSGEMNVILREVTQIVGGCGATMETTLGVLFSVGDTLICSRRKSAAAVREVEGCR